KRSSSSMSKSLEKLSTGFKVNRGADGPAALVISEKQRAQIAGLEQAIENTDKAVSVVQTAEGALNEVNSLLVKVRSLALDSANEGVNDADAMAANQAEIDNALETIDRIANSTQFSTKKLLNGDAGTTVDSGLNTITASGSADTQDGTYSVDVITAAEKATGTFTASTNLSADETIVVNDISITLSANSTQQEVIDRINEFSDQTGVVAEVDSTTATLTRLTTTEYGADASLAVTGTETGTINDDGVDVEARVDDGTTTYVKTGTGESVTFDTGNAKGLTLDFADATQFQAVAAGTGLTDVTVKNNSLTFQIGANQNQTAMVSIDKSDSEALGLTGLDVSSADAAQESIAKIDAAIDTVTNERGELGAFQANTLESTASNLRTTLENSINAESIIRDTDFASEIAEFTKQQVLVQAGTSLLGSANQTSQLVLSLL
ncbi:MAG: flagellin, partial [Planctomycetota bacterium]